MQDGLEKIISVKGNVKRRWGREKQMGNLEFWGPRHNLKRRSSLGNGGEGRMEDSCRLSRWEPCDMDTENTLTFLLMPDLPIHPTKSQLCSFLKNMKRTPLRAEPQPSTRPASLFLENSPSFPNRHLPDWPSGHSFPLPFPGVVRSPNSPTPAILDLNFSHASNPGTSLKSFWPGQKVTLKTSEKPKQALQ